MIRAKYQTPRGVREMAVPANNWPAAAGWQVLELTEAAVTPRQFRLAMLAAGVDLADIEQAIAALPAEQRQAARVEWEFASEIRRDHPLVAQLAAALDKTDAEIDQVFLVAAGM